MEVVPRDQSYRDGTHNQELRARRGRTGSHVRSEHHSKLYVAASVFFLLWSMSVLAIIDRSIYGDWPGKHGDKLTQTLNLLGILISIFLFWWATRKRVAQFNRVLPLAAASLPVISLLWSGAPGVTFTQGSVYFFVVLGAIGLVEASDGDELMDLVMLICGLSAVASIVQFFIFPEPDDFRGIFSQKNVLGQVMVGGVLAALHCARVKGGFRYTCVIALCTIVAFMTKSSTSIFAIFVLLWLDMLGRLYLKGKSSRPIASCLAIVSVSIVIFFVMNADLIFEVLGKDSTLTGRTMIWSYAIDKIGEKPILGWGFSAFWWFVGPVPLREGENWVTFFTPSNAHNGMLEFLLELGVVGTALFIFLLLRNFVLAVKCMNGPAGQFGLSSVLLLIGILVIGVSEAVLLAPLQLWTSLFFMMGFFCEKELWLARVARFTPNKQKPTRCQF
jgi:exopolysaccharide production protein ExoQ